MIFELYLIFLLNKSDIFVSSFYLEFYKLSISNIKIYFNVYYIVY